MCIITAAYAGMKSLLALIIVARLYLIGIPLLLEYTGVGLNQAVLIANGGKFPVMENERDQKTIWGIVDSHGLSDDTHCLMTKETHLNWLGDYLRFRWPDGPSIASWGDVLQDFARWMEDFTPTIWLTLIIHDLWLSRRRGKIEA